MRVSRAAFAATAATFCLGVLLSVTATPPRLQSAQAQTSAQVVRLSLNPAHSKVHWTLDSTLHTVHGTFLLKNGAVQFDRQTGEARGEITIMATSGDTGNNSRDEKMHKEVLQSDKFPEAVFRPSRIEGTVASSGGSDFKVHGTFLLHGNGHEITVLMHAELSGETWKGTGQFAVPYIQWGLKNPSNFLLKVQPIVNVEVEIAGNLQNAS